MSQRKNNMPNGNMMPNNMPNTNMNPEIDFLNVPNIPNVPKNIPEFPPAGFGTNGGMTVNEPVISFKIYDSCRFQDCCTRRKLSRIRVCETTTINGVTYHAGSILTVPSDIASIAVEDLIVKDTIILSKKPSPFRNGYWDIDLKYIFEFKVIFSECDGTIIGEVKCGTFYNKKLNLFGSTSVDLVLTTDLIDSDRNILQGDPFVLAESKAIPLSAEVMYHIHRGFPGENTEPGELDVTIGLFSIVKLFRIVDLLTETKGFYIPTEAQNCYPIDPCDFFDGLDFPMDIFAPPQKNEFMRGLSSNIPSNRQRRNDGFGDDNRRGEHRGNHRHHPHNDYDNYDGDCDNCNNCGNCNRNCDVPNHGFGDGFDRRRFAGK